MTYLEDGNCEISNNLAENSIHPFTVGRKNWLFAGSPSEAKASACVYSLVETAKANDINPYKYLELLLKKLPKLQLQNNNDELELLMPWNPQVKEACKMK
jgi:hypothetical protein